MAYTKANLKRLRAIIREGRSIVARIEAKVKREENNMPYLEDVLVRREFSVSRADYLNDRKCSGV